MKFRVFGGIMTTTATRIRRVMIGKENRVGLYVSPRTRNRLNLLKARLAESEDRSINLDETITYMLDKEGVTTRLEPELA